MPFPYAIGPAEFAQWHGPPPDTLRYTAAGHTRPGVPGVAFHQFWSGAPFHVNLEAWFPKDELLGLPALRVAQESLITWQNDVQGQAHALRYGNVEWSAIAGCRFFVSEIIPVECRAVLRLTGFGVDYKPGAILVSRWTLTPQP